MLSLLARVYGAVVALRNYLYDRGIFEVHDLGVRTISIGNITAGGTGKTPLVAYVARLLADRGEKVCVLTRGYGRKDERARVVVSDGMTLLADATTGGDEPVELATSLLGKAIVIADSDRVAAAEWAKRKFGITVFVLDDGFQHRKAKRDVDIVCVDATDPFGGGEFLPAGRLREQPDGIVRADVVVITRVEQVADISNLISQISDLNSEATIVECRTRLAGIRALKGGTPSGERTQFFAFCGLGNPSNFFDLLRREGIGIAGTLAFRDHYAYRQSDMETIEAAAASSGAESLITTGKDAVKLELLEFSLPCCVAEIELELDDPGGFESML